MKIYKFIAKFKINMNLVCIKYINVYKITYIKYIHPLQHLKKNI